MRKVLITGGAGFIGRRMVTKLVELGNEVYVYDSMKLGSVKDFKHIMGKIHIINGDMLNYSTLKGAVKKVDQVLHLAAPSSFLMYVETPIEATVATYVGFLNLMEAMRIARREHLVFASTSAVYEGLPLPWREDVACFPPDLKALSKLQNEQIAKQYGDRYGIRSTALRPLSVYGVGEHTKMGYANVISLFVWAMVNGERPIVWGDGTQKRDFIYVDECADLIIRILDFNSGKQEDNFQIFNVGTGKETSFNEVIGIINRKLGTELEPIYVEIPIEIYTKGILGDMTKVKNMLRWEAKITVEEGIDEIIKVAMKKELEGMELSKYQKHALNVKQIGD